MFVVVRFDSWYTGNNASLGNKYLSLHVVSMANTSQRIDNLSSYSSYLVLTADDYYGYLKGIVCNILV